MIEARQLLLTIGVTSTSRVLVLRDRLLGRIGKSDRKQLSQLVVSRHAIDSGDHLLDAVYVTPNASAAKASVLICHGIGETVDHWLGVQQLLAANGVASMVFDYAGFGRSSGLLQRETMRVGCGRRIYSFATADRVITSLSSWLFPGQRYRRRGCFEGAGPSFVALRRIHVLRKATVSVGIPKFFLCSAAYYGTPRSHLRLFRSGACRSWRKGSAVPSRNGRRTRCLLRLAI